MVNSLEKPVLQVESRSKKRHFRAPERTKVHEERRIMSLMKRLANLVNGYSLFDQDQFAKSNGLFWRVSPCGIANKDRRIISSGVTKSAKRFIRVI